MNFSDLWNAIFAAMKEPLAAAWGQARTFAETESKKIAHSLLTITQLYLLPEGDLQKITREQAELLLDIQVSASRGILLTIATIGLIAAQRALEAGLDAVKNVVNAAIGFAII
jgi:hypothetical protein